MIELSFANIQIYFSNKKKEYEIKLYHPHLMKQLTSLNSPS